MPPILHNADRTTLSTTTLIEQPNVPRPLNLVNGDLVILWLFLQNNGALSQPFDFPLPIITAGDTSTTARPILYVWAFIADNEPVSYSGFSVGTTTVWRMYADRVTGHDPNDPIDQIGTPFVNTGGTTVTSLGVTGLTPTVNDTLLLAARAARASTVTDQVAPSGMDTTFLNPGNADAHGAQADLLDMTPTGTLTFSWGTARAATGAAFNIKPAPSTERSLYIDGGYY